MRAVQGGLFAVLLFLLLFPTSAIAGDDPEVSVDLVLASDEITAGETLQVGAVVKNTGTEGRFVLVEAFLAPVDEPIGIPPTSRWERFVWLVLHKITSDCEFIHVPAGETRVARLDIEVHPRMHGTFDVVGRATSPKGTAVDRSPLLVKITAPPSNGGVLVHGRLYRFGPFRLLVTDDGHIYEPKGDRADFMFEILDDLYPAPDGVTVLGGILPNTVGGFGVELEVDLFRFDRDPGTPIGYRWRTLSRGASSQAYSGPKEEIVRSKSRLREVMTALGAELTGKKPKFRKEMVAVVTVPGTTMTRIRVGRVYEKDGVLQVHYQVVNAGPGYAKVDAFAQPYHIVALPRFNGDVRFIRHDISIRTDAYRTGVLDVARPLDLITAKPDARKLVKSVEKSAVANVKSVDAK